MKNNKTLFVILAIIILYLIVYILEPMIENNIKLITAILITIIVILYYLYKHLKKEKINLKSIMYLVIIIGILLRAMYVVYTPITERQHDVYSIEDEGHLGYIYTVYETGKLPETNNIQFYHPPLFHSIAAGWLKVNDMLNIDLNRSLEGIQIITAIFSSLTLLVVYKIVDKLELKNIYKLIVITVMAIHPTFIILAGSINNDILMVLLSFCIILYLIKWKEKANIINTIILAFFTGCCVMTKISGAIMAIPIMVIFIDKIVETLKNNKKDLLYLFELFLVFGLISLPLGLWHPIRNAILFKQPLGGVLIPSASLYIGDYSLLQRFFSISFKELFGQQYCLLPGNYNIFAYIIKTSILGEYSYNNIDLLATLLKLTNTIIVFISMFFTIFITVKNNTKSKNYIIGKILLITWFINIISYYSFNVQYPFSCTMDFRYLVPTIFTGIVLICIGLDEYIKNDIIKKSIECIIILFSILACILVFAI